MRRLLKRGLKALGRLKAGTMNETEAADAATVDRRRVAGDVAWYKFEGIKLRVADNALYTPDFFVMLADGKLEAHEVKGHRVDDARAKVKIAADLCPMRFIAIKAKPKKNGGG